MTLYHDPTTPYDRPSLIGDLLTVPATASHHQLENQTTTVLAWLIDRSPVIAQAVLDLFLGPDTPAGARVGARTQVSLPKPGGGVLFPDLSVCVEARVAQLLIEVKVDSDMHVYPEFGGVSQPDAYRQLWLEGSSGDAAIRAVGTLTRAGSDATPDPSRLVARDVTWRELGDALRSLDRSRLLEDDVRLVALSFVDAIDARIAPLVPGNAEVTRFFRDHATLLERVADAVAKALGASEPNRRIKGEAYFGRRVPLTDKNGVPLFVRIYLSPAGTRLNLPGAPDALIAAPERDPNGTLEPAAAQAAEASGFARTKDLDGYWLHRRVWPVDGLEPRSAAADIVARLRAMRLLSGTEDAPPVE